MGVKSLIYSAIAALTFSATTAFADSTFKLKEPSLQQERISQSLGNFKLTANFNLTPSSSFIPDEPEESKQEPLEEIVNQAGAGSIKARFELPNGVTFSYFNKSFETSLLSYDIKEDNLQYAGTSIKADLLGIIPAIRDKTTTIAGIPFTTLITEGESQLPIIAKEAEQLLSTFWNDIKNSIQGREFEAGITFAGFFRDLLPQYTADGVITPDEAIKIKEAVTQKVEEYYKNSLTGEEKGNINNAVDRFSNLFNLKSERYSSIQHLRYILGQDDPLSSFLIGSTTIRKLYSLLDEVKPLYKLTIDKNAFRLESNLYARFFAQADSFHTYYFQNHFFRHGTLSLTTGIGEAHLLVTGEMHGGKPLRNFFSEKYEQDFDALELLLGYQPVFIDGSITGSFKGHAEFENININGYEVIIQHGTNELGLGVTQGYVYRASAVGEASSHLKTNSYTLTLTGNASSYFTIHEERGIQSSLFLSFLNNDNAFWSATYFNIINENLRTRTQTWRGYFKLHATLSDETNYHYWLWNKSKVETLKQQFTPGLAAKIGFHMHPGDPFFFLQGKTIGGGVVFTTPWFLATVESGFKKYTAADMLIPIMNIEGESPIIPEQAFHNLKIRTTQIQDSPFPAKRAVMLEEQQQFYSALNGLFLELAGRYQHEESFPYELPAIFRIGTITAKSDEFYFRLGYEGDFTQRVIGAYTSIGNTKFELHSQLQQEQVPSRNSHATLLTNGGRIHLGNSIVTLSGTLYVPQIGRLYANRPNRGDSIYNVSIEGPLEDLIQVVDNVETFLWKEMNTPVKEVSLLEFYVPF